MPIEESVLVDAARAARRFAVAPFSNFAVGAALETADGVVVTGCNVENATYGLTVCAERIALFKALSEGHRRFTRVVGGGGHRRPDAAVRRLPPAPVGVRRGPRGGAGQRGRRSRPGTAWRPCFRIRSTPACSTADRSGRLTSYNRPDMLPTIEWQDDAVVMVDQRKLPGKEIYVRCKTANEVAKAIKTMVIRGAPAIGVSAAMGLALGVKNSTATGTRQLLTEFLKSCDVMAATRPTAVNLFWAIERMKQRFSALAQAGASVGDLKTALVAEARLIHDEDVASCKALGAFGATLVPAEATILTHCNAGALATAGYGTALGVIRGAVDAGKTVKVLADETRPFLQGARLTAWELVKDNIDTTVITDNMAGALMRQGLIDLVVVGADRIAANGDTANKIGTYSVAVLAKENGVPFYVAAPLSTIDLATPNGERIPIEERPAREVTHVGPSQVTPDGAKIRNPAFDVTPARYITAIVTEKGIARPDFTTTPAAAVRGARRAGAAEAAARRSARPAEA